jgi:hypothetical protein
LQDCGVLPAHCVCSGAHVPVHDPFTHVWLVHAAGDPQPPLALHVSTPLLEHCVDPSAHDPEQTPLTHVFPTHATGDPQLPALLQVSTPLPEH